MRQHFFNIVSGWQQKREKVAKNIGRVRDVKLSPEGLIHIAVENKGIFRLNPKNE